MSSTNDSDTQSSQYKKHREDYKHMAHWQQHKGPDATAAVGMHDALGLRQA